MKELVKYDAACTALAKACRVDEVKSIRDKAVALAAYAKQAQNLQLERQATEIRVRAERRAGQLLAEMPKAKGAKEPGTKRGSTRSNDTTTSTLDEIGVTKDQSSQWQKLAKVPDADFEQALAGENAGIPSGRTIVRVGLHNAKVERDAKLRKAGEGVPYEGPLPAGMALVTGRLGVADLLHKFANRLINTGNYYTEALAFEGGCSVLGEHGAFVYGLHDDIIQVFALAEKIREYADKIDKVPEQTSEAAA